MSRIKPATRLALSLVLLTVSLVLVGDLFGLLPDARKAMLQARKDLVEALAITLSANAEKKDTETLKRVMENVVNRNPDVFSAALRGASGVVLVRIGDHDQHWVIPEDGHSTATHAQVPIFNDDTLWGTVEVAFAAPSARGLLGLINSPMVRMIAYLSVFGFLAYLFLLKRSLRELDPSAVIPDRVQAALNAMAEGVLVLDPNEQIVLANRAFAERTGWEAANLLGRKASDLRWNWEREDERARSLPWLRALAEGTPQMGTGLVLDSPNKARYRFLVNSVPIMDGKERPRGVLVTLDDVTELQQKNEDLERMLEMVQESQAEVRRKNRQLEVLAREDSLTGCLNRRSFFSRLEEVFAGCRVRGQALSCLMIDIDHFKRVNDNYGHATGDQVIRAVSQTLRDSIREGDLIGRYGGEEFCVALTATDLRQAALKAEALRESIETLRFSDLQTTRALKITVSLGVSDLAQGPSSIAELIDQADRALLHAKETGRNRVVRWNEVSGIRSSATGIDAGDAQADEANHSDDSNPPTGTFPALSERRRFVLTVDNALGRLRREDDMLAVLLLDVDMFKRVNHSLGHAAGDEALFQLGERLRGALRASDLSDGPHGQLTECSAARVGADEFAVLLSGFRAMDQIKTIAQRIRDTLSQPFDVQGHIVHLTVTVGVSVYPSGGGTAENLLKNADIAIQHARRRGAGGYHVFTNELSRTGMRQLELESELRVALEEKQFELYYQTKHEVATGKITGIEALLRWAHPEKGTIAPGEFIAVAEYSGLILPIGEWVLRTACEHARQWLDAGVEDLRVAVNLSPHQFRQENLLQMVRQILQDTVLPGRHLELEITETSVMNDLEEATLTMRRLQQLGIQMTIDDFGTGYSSLYYLKRFPIDSLKIDRSFIHDVTADTDYAAIVNAIVAMAQSLRLRVVAEGVENMRQVDHLVEAGCDEMQGYLLSRPLPHAEITRLLTSSNVLTLPRAPGARGASRGPVGT
jgi:diguanylate cyclase (GGDEF)-like protein/PAS domain S-box-containing protein